MELKVALKLCLLLVASYPGVIGREFSSNAYLRHWLRADPAKGDCTASGDLIADPDNCHNFYVCMDGTDPLGPQTCSEDTFTCFAPADASASSKGVCIKTDGISADDTAKCETACEGGGDDSTCTFECPDSVSGVVVASQDCTKFKLCFEPPTRGEVEMPCPNDKPYFNGETCGTDPAACCNCQVPTTCDTLTAKLADPHDCHKYYICLDIDGDGTNAPEGPSDCPNGGSFVGTDCDDKTTECVPACEGDGNSTTPAGGSTIPAGGSTTPNSDSTTPTGDSTTPTTTGDGCTDVADFTCLEKGFYARCPFCDPSYFKCDKAASTPRIGHCAGDLVFNPTPEFAYCVRPENCPFGL